MSTGKRAVITGVANNKSIAWGIGEALRGAGYDLCFTYPDERLESRVRELAETIPGSFTLPLNVARDEDFDIFARELEKRWPDGFDALLHSIAFANRDDLKNPFWQTHREGFRIAMDISAYSFVALTRASLPLLEKRRGAAIALTYLGGQRVIPNYNVMGVAKAALDMSMRYLAAELGKKNVRVNCLSPGPMKTLAAKGIGGFNEMFNHVVQHSPLGRPITLEEVGQAALNLFEATGTTGQVVFVDGGYSIVES